MIRLEHLTKYYNKKKLNQFIVCNDITLDFDKTGLVMILGSSGSGKTTLLNVISGMDDFDSGRVIFDDVVFNKYNHKHWDLIRKHKVGYVYQNYHLLKNISVYMNIEPVFKMQGITDDQEIRQNISRLLGAVGLENYSDRLAKQLSGGQQQRVAFARALANNPEVILADEPTGNLDSRTTIELMKVIKEISKTRLVIMVTHEQSLCNFYADRVIQIEDGKIIKDYLNDPDRILDLAQEHIINLYELDKKKIQIEQLNVTRYSNKKNPESLDIDLIERNQTLYVKVNSKSLKRTKYIDSDSEIIILEKPEDDVKDENPFILDDIYTRNKEDVPVKIFRWKDTFKYAFRKLNLMQGGGRMLFLTMMLVGIILAVSVGLIGEIYHVEEPFNVINSNYISIRMDSTLYDDYELIESVSGVEQLMLVSEPFKFKVSTNNYYEVRTSIDVFAIPIDIKFFDETTLVYGTIPEGYEILIDQSVADQMIRENSYRGILTYDDILNCQFKLQTNGTDTSIAVDTALYFNISGIANSNSQSVWMAEELIYSLMTPYLVDYLIMGDNFQIISGDLPSRVTYIMLNDQYPDVVNGEIPYNIGVATGTYYVSGIYQYEVDGVTYDFQKAMVSTTDFIKTKFYLYRYSRFSSFSLLAYTNDVEGTLAALEAAGYNASANIYVPTIAQQIKLQENQTLYLLGLSGVLMSAFSIYLIMRSSLIARMYEVSVYRGIGVSRKEIRRIFLAEIIMTTTLSSIIGFLLTVLLLVESQSTLQIASVTYYSGLSIILVVIGIYAINLAFGLIPVNAVLRKTPANIIKRSDL